MGWFWGWFADLFDPGKCPSTWAEHEILYLWKKCADLEERVSKMETRGK